MEENFVYFFIEIDFLVTCSYFLRFQTMHVNTHNQNWCDVKTMFTNYDYSHLNTHIDQCESTQYPNNNLLLYLSFDSARVVVQNVANKLKAPLV